MTTSTAIVTTAPEGTFEIRDITLKEMRSDEIVVRMVATGVCHTDFSCANGTIPVPSPIILGHEGAGVVECVGPDVYHVQVGDHVVLSFPACGAELWGSIVIYGVGSVGLAGVMSAAKLTPAARIVAVDVSEEKLQAASKLGATHVINSSEQDVVKAVRDLTNGNGSDCAFDTTGNGKVIEAMIAASTNTAKVASVGSSPIGHFVNIEVASWIGRGISYSGACQGSAVPRVTVPHVAPDPASRAIHFAEHSMNGNHSSAGFSELFQDPSKVVDEYKIPDVPLGSSRNVKAIYIGMGMSGIDFAYHAGKVPNLEVQLYEKNDAPGGTWLENQYPGCACDVPIATYQYRWALKPDWDHYYAYQPDILKYLQDVAEEHDLTRFCKFKHQVTSAEWLEDKGKWRVAVMEDNDPSKIRYDEAEFLINGSGILNSWKWPDIAGRKEFKGDMVHSARWDKNVDLKGKRIAVIGIGSSAIQVVPSVLEQSEKLYVFARSKTWITPGYASKYAGPDDSDELKKRWRNDSTDYLRYVKSIELDLSGIWKMFLKEGSANAEATEFARHIMENKLNHRKDLIEGLVPTEFPFGCRRPTPGTGFLEALANPKTTLLKGGIKAFDATG
ncbi:sterigmatocystin biosynthesis monooxygenase stcW, partial [Fusarium pseudocircinatum]